MDNGSASCGRRKDFHPHSTGFSIHFCLGARLCARLCVHMVGQNCSKTFVQHRLEGLDWLIYAAFYVVTCVYDKAQCGEGEQQNTSIREMLP